MKKVDNTVWVFPLPSGLEIRLTNVSQTDLDFLAGVEKQQAQVKNLKEAVQMAIEMIETNTYERRHVRWKLLDALAHASTLEAAPDSDLNEGFNMAVDYLQPSHARQVAEIEALTTRVAELEKEAARWKNHHATEVRRARILKERTDMPIERVQAYEQWGKDQTRIAELEAALARLGEEKLR